MIQDIGVGRYNNAYRPVSPAEDSLVMCFRKGQILIRSGKGRDVFFGWKELGEETKNKAFFRYLFAIDDRSYFLMDEKDLPEQIRNQSEWITPADLRSPDTGTQTERFAAITGFQIYQWYRTRVYCPACGRKMQHSEKERMMHCPECGVTEYPKICPAVIVGVWHKDRLLLTKYAQGYGHYALIAGFAEVGETIEETVHREVMEETGLKVKNLTYYKSQPWSFTDTLLFGFFAELDGEETVHLDENELSSARWCTRDEIPADDGVSLTREMMRVFREGKMPRI